VGIRNGRRVAGSAAVLPALRATCCARELRDWTGHHCGICRAGTCHCELLRVFHPHLLAQRRHCKPLGNVGKSGEAIQAGLVDRHGVAGRSGDSDDGNGGSGGQSDGEAAATAARAAAATRRTDLGGITDALEAAERRFSSAARQSEPQGEGR
jgi:hypothetical protein